MAEEKKATTALALLDNKALQTKMAAVMPPGMDLNRQMEFMLALAKMFDASKKPVRPKSVIACMYTATSLGLSLNAVKGEAYLVPFSGDCTFMPGYKGLIKLMRNAGLKDIAAKIVYEGDYFKYEEDEKGTHYLHRPTNDLAKRGAPEWGVSRAVLPDGTISALVIPYFKIEAIKTAALARTPKSPWKDYEEEMGQKTCIRIHSKVLPASDEVATAVKWDEKVELNEHRTEIPEALTEILGADVDIVDEQPEQPAAEGESTADVDQRINGVKAFLGPKEFEILVGAAEKKYKKKLDAFILAEKEDLLKKMEATLDS